MTIPALPFQMYLQKYLGQKKRANLPSSYNTPKVITPADQGLKGGISSIPL